MSRTLQALFIFCVLIKSSEREAKFFQEIAYACLDSCGSTGKKKTNKQKYPDYDGDGQGTCR